jgi:hypothetical protein
MTSRESAFIFRGALLVIALTTTCGAAIGATVHGEIDFFLPGQKFGGSSSNVYADSRELVTGSLINGTVRRAAVEIDFAAGTLKGEQSALDSDPELFSVQSQARAGWDADLQIVALPGSPTDVRVPLDLRVTLSAAFLTSDLLSQTSFALNTFSETLAPHPALGSASVPFAQVVYDYDWLRSLGTDEFRHQKFASVNDALCPACTAEVIVPDPAFLYEYRNGFREITLRTVINVEPGFLFNPHFSLTSRADVVNFAASGDWSNTAQFGYLLPEGYALAQADGTQLNAWNLASAVPEPHEYVMLIAGLGLLVLTVKRRHISTM